ncbi:hypothetical protein HK100_004350 [Physocladia obscura]|uniref:Uncharacterized protein n=1 Tax=Physocladia obscura TaxID=109957 RepID=A0AAD5STZ0_9FUNG|nr:hypothetical protein HK100_004350 [Physocladia obscura]
MRQGGNGNGNSKAKSNNSNSKIGTNSNNKRNSRVLATIVRVAPRSTYSYPSCNRCLKKLSSALSAANPPVSVSVSTSSFESSPLPSSGSRIPQRRAFGDASSNANSATTITATTTIGTTTPRVIPAEISRPASVHIFTCLSCGASFSKDAVSYRYSVTLTVSINNRLQNIAVFGNSLNPLFGMSCTPLFHTLKNKAIQDFGTQTPTIDGRKVLNALDQVAAGIVIILVIKNQTLSAMNELSDLMERGLKIKDNAEINVVARQYQQWPGIAVNPKKSATSFSFPANDNKWQKDFVISAVEFPKPPVTTVAHILGLLQSPNLQIIVPTDKDITKNRKGDLFKSFSRDLFQELVASQSQDVERNAPQSNQISPPTTPQQSILDPIFNSLHTNITSECHEENFELSAISLQSFFGILSSPPPRLQHNQSANSSYESYGPEITLVAESPPQPSSSTNHWHNLTPILIKQQQKLFETASSPFVVPNTPQSPSKSPTPILHLSTRRPSSERSATNDSSPTSAIILQPRRVSSIKRCGSPADVAQPAVRDLNGGGFTDTGVTISGIAESLANLEVSPKKKTRYCIEKKRTQNNKSICSSNTATTSLLAAGGTYSFFQQQKQPMRFDGLEDILTADLKFDFGNPGNIIHRKNSFTAYDVDGDEDEDFDFKSQFFRNVAAKAAVIAGSFVPSENISNW